jgi:hypothetical protein
VQRLVAQPLLQLVPVGDVLDHRDGVRGGAVGVAQQRDRHVGPDDLAVLAVVRLLHAEVVAVAADEVGVQVAVALQVGGVEEVGLPQPEQLVHRVAEQPGHRGVGLDDVPVEVTDADGHRGALEQRPEPRLTRPQLVLDLGVRGGDRAGQVFLLDQGAVTQRRGVAAGQPGQQVGDALGPLLHAARPRRVAQHRERRREHPGVGQARLGERGTDAVGRPGVERVGVHRPHVPPGQLTEQGEQPVGTHRHEPDAADRLEPARGELRDGRFERVVRRRHGGPVHPAGGLG